jgi:hypothetical protein
MGVIQQAAMRAEDVARERLINFVDEKLAGEWSDTSWEFWTWLLEQAKGRRLDHSGYKSFAYQDDEAAARAARDAAMEAV